MPRRITGRSDQQPKRKRAPYRRDRAPDIAAIEGRRKVLEISAEALAGRAAIDRRTYERMRRSGLAFPRQISALRMALRSLEKERRQEGELFPVGVEP